MILLELEKQKRVSAEQAGALVKLQQENLALKERVITNAKPPEF